uniref:Transforming acidic coiled-coil-containing protein C-terminal domain-containing protein n=2 Tax=Graphocephala atropunctata TaxID=36148 RepID=A0A1B6KP51_9HEMI
MRSVHPSDLNQSEAGPITADELSTQDLEFQDGANLDLDFFTRVGDAETVVKSSLARDSLYVKFDPIVGAIVSKTVSDSFAMPPPPAPQAEITSSEEQQDSQSDEPKDDSLNQSQGEPQRTPGRSPALEAVQKLISLTPPSASSGTPVRTPSTPSKSERGSVDGSNPNTPSPRITPENLKREKLRLEETLKSQALAHKAESDKRDAELLEKKAKVSELEAELKAATERELKLRKEVHERTKSRQQLSLVMEEYEKTISQLVAQKEEEKKEFEVQKDLLMKERDTAMQHLNNMEIAFNDVHQKYERSKTVIEGMKANEDLLKKSLTDYDDAIKSSNSKYESLKNHAVRQLDTANHELDLIRRSHQVEQAKLKAMLKKAEVRVTSLEESLEQKSKENQELAAICDELISKVGSGPN